MASSSLSSGSADTRTTDSERADGVKQTTPIDLGGVPLFRSVLLLVLASVIGLIYWFNPLLEVEPTAGVVMELPAFVGTYYGKPGAITDVEKRVLPKDTEFARRFYDDGHGHQINCSIVLSGAEQRSIHRPEGCLTGQGWTIVGQDYIPIQLSSGHPLTARRLTLERQAPLANGGTVTVRAYYDYWFVGENVTTASEMWRVLLSNWDRVVHNRAHRWAYVSVFSLITDNLVADGANPEQTQTLLLDFAKQVVPTFQISEMPAQAKN